MVCPIIDVISDDTFEYMAGSDMTYGGFNWKLNFRWYPVPQREMDRRKGDRTLPVRWVFLFLPPWADSDVRGVIQMLVPDADLGAYSCPSVISCWCFRLSLTPFLRSHKYSD